MIRPHFFQRRSMTLRSLFYSMSQSVPDGYIKVQMSDAMFILVLTWDKEWALSVCSWQTCISDCLARERKKDEDSYLNGSIVKVSVLSVVLIGNSYAVNSNSNSNSGSNSLTLTCNAMIYIKKCIYECSNISTPSEVMTILLVKIEYQLVLF